MKVRDVQGISEHIVDGKLHLKLKDFLELVLKNSTDINLTRLDVYTAADQIEAAKAVYDPTLALRVQYLSLGGSAGKRTQRSGHAEQFDAEFVSNYQQILTTGQTFNGGLNAIRSSSNNSFNFSQSELDRLAESARDPAAAPEPQQHPRRGPIQIARTQLLITSDQSEAHIANCWPRRRASIGIRFARGITSACCSRPGPGAEIV